jgi:hypothetical protein
MAAASTQPAAKAAPASGSRMRVSIWWIASAVALIGGYADLWRGGETLAPILLVLGYCVLVPIAILR